MEGEAPHAPTVLPARRRHGRPRLAAAWKSSTCRDTTLAYSFTRACAKVPVTLALTWWVWCGGVVCLACRYGSWKAMYDADPTAFEEFTPPYFTVTPDR